jgi:hypothetical protein
MVRTTAQHAFATDRLYSPIRLVDTASPVAATDLARINREFAHVPLSADDIFIFRGIISTDAVDSYFTHMDPATSLANFAEDAGAGCPLLDSHENRRLPIGQSFTGVLQPVPGGLAEGVPATRQVLAGYYLLRGHTVEGQAVDDYIRGIVGGTYRRMSVGFGGPDCQITCDIDGSDIFDWDSDYYPGQRLKDGRVVTYTVTDARKLESSLVYNNSTPGALVQRVAELAARRKVAPAEAARLGERWGVRFDGPGRLVSGLGGVELRITHRDLDGQPFHDAEDLAAAARTQAAFQERQRIGRLSNPARPPAPPGSPRVALEIEERRLGDDRPPLPPRRTDGGIELLIEERPL